mmetsp:Transcript_4658/g.13914  ORF Transcript_4658/g.13914 Transcript_4658/m.13914 type:complete len:268 (-) Transcript_4658:152-955(-)
MHTLSRSRHPVDDVDAGVRLDQAGHLSRLELEGRLLEAGHHPPPSERAEVPSALGAAAVALHRRQLLELGPHVVRSRDLLPQAPHQILRLILGDRDVRIAPGRGPPRPAVLLQQVEHLHLLLPRASSHDWTPVPLPLSGHRGLAGLLPLRLPRVGVDVVPADHATHEDEDRQNKNRKPCVQVQPIKQTNKGRDTRTHDEIDHVDAPIRPSIENESILPSLLSPLLLPLAIIPLSLSLSLPFLCSDWCMAPKRRRPWPLVSMTSSPTA